MTMSRRNFIALAGGGTVLAAGGGAGAFVSTRTPAKALMPWQLAGSYDDPRKNALSFAVLAPNPHNRQPWLADLREPDTITIHRDKALNLPETDPFDRQLTIGMGCFSELLSMAAAQAGHRVDFEFFPQGEEGPVAQVRFSPGATPDPLFAHVMDRRSCKEPFEDRKVPAELITALADHATIIDEEQQVADLIELTWDAWMVEATTYRTMKESVDLMRMGKREINANPDGIDLGGPFLESLMLFGLLSREAQLDPQSTSFKQGVEIYRDMLHATPAYAAITTAGNSRLDQIDAGRRWLRLNLATTSMGLALHPVSQALQEYAEMAPHYSRMHAMLAEPGHTVQMLGRLGYGPQTPYTPRWPVDTRIVNEKG